LRRNSPLIQNSPAPSFRPITIVRLIAFSDYAAYNSLAPVTTSCHDRPSLQRVTNPYWFPRPLRPVGEPSAGAEVGSGTLAVGREAPTVGGTSRPDPRAPLSGVWVRVPDSGAAVAAPNAVRMRPVVRQLVDPGLAAPAPRAPRARRRTGSGSVRPVQRFVVGTSRSVVWNRTAGAAGR
jgi:hypothetical protein